MRSPNKPRDTDDLVRRVRGKRLCTDPNACGHSENFPHDPETPVCKLTGDECPALAATADA